MDAIQEGGQSGEESERQPEGQLEGQPAAGKKSAELPADEEAELWRNTLEMDAQRRRVRMHAELGFHRHSRRNRLASI